MKGGGNPSLAGCSRPDSDTVKRVPDVIPYLAMPRPVWRGKMHAWAFFISIPLAIALIVVASGAAATVGASIYAATLLGLFGTSAAYHTLAQSPRARQIMQRLDHAMIYLLIAGTYVPLCLVALPPEWGIPILVIVGGLAIFGVVMKMAAFERVPWLSYSLYLVMGWAAIIAGPALYHNLTGPQMGLIVAGGAAYTIGFPVLFTRRPDPWPTTFGYHEVWHSCTVLAALCHFALVGLLVST